MNRCKRLKWNIFLSISLFFHNLRTRNRNVTQDILPPMPLFLQMSAVAWDNSDFSLAQNLLGMFIFWEDSATARAGQVRLAKSFRFPWQIFTYLWEYFGPNNLKNLWLQNGWNDRMAYGERPFAHSKVERAKRKGRIGKTFGERFKTKQHLKSWALHLKWCCSCSGAGGAPGRQPGQTGARAFTVTQGQELRLGADIQPSHSKSCTLSDGVAEAVFSPGFKEAWLQTWVWVGNKCQYLPCEFTMARLLLFLWFGVRLEPAIKQSQLGIFPGTSDRYKQAP